MRLPHYFWSRHSPILQVSLLFPIGLVRNAARCVQFAASLNIAAHAQQNSPADIMNAGSVRIQLKRGIDLAQRFGILFFSLQYSGQLVMCAGEVRVEVERFTEIALGFIICLLQVINQS